jgi:hypothetical protein
MSNYLRRGFTLLAAVFMTLGLTSTLQAQCIPYTIPYFEGFESGFTDQASISGICLEQESVTGTQVWTANNTQTSFNRSPRTGGWNAYLRYGNEDWIFIPVSLTANTTYNFSAYARQDGSNSSNSDITVAYGTSAASASMSNSIVATTGIVNGNYQEIAGGFTPTTTGVYYVGINGYMNGSPWYISLDDISITAAAANDAVATSITNALACVAGADSVAVEVSNNGTSTITSLPISTSINGGTFSSAGTFTVNIPFGNSQTVMIPVTAVSGTNNIIVATNLTGDNDNTNDTISASYFKGNVELNLTIESGDYGGEVYWALVDSATGTVIDNVGPNIYANNTTYNYTYCLDSNATYTFNAYDDWGDGWNGGTYTFSNCSGLVIVANNGGAVPSNGTSGAGLETTENFTIPSSCPITDASLASIIDVLDCGGTADSLSITIQNLGGDTLTSVPVMIALNGGTYTSAGTYAGSIAAGASDDFTFPVTLLSGFNTIEVALNVTGDGDLTNDSISYTFLKGNKEVTLEINTASFGAEVAWALIDVATGNVIDSVPPSTYASSSNYTYIYCLDSNATYTFNAYDDFGDGWNGGTYAFTIDCGSPYILANNGGNSPTNGVTPVNFELETTETFSVLGSCPVKDAQLVSISGITEGCGPGERTVQVVVGNNATDTISNIEVLFSTGGTYSPADTVTNTLAPGQLDTISFTVTITGNTTLTMVTNLTNETNTSNDSISVNLVSLPIVSTFPYTESWETGAADWFVGGTPTTWELGVPANAIIDTASDGTQAWVTNLDGDYVNNEKGYVQSPCFNVSSLNIPEITMDVWWESEFSWDGMNVQYSDNGGATWNLLGAQNTGTNWYTDGTVSGLNGAGSSSQVAWSGRDGTGSSGGSNGWLTAVNEMDSTGLDSIIFRVYFGSDGSGIDEGTAFDYFNIAEAPTYDASITIFTGSAANTCSANDTLMMVIENFGTGNISDFDIIGNQNGGLNDTLTFVDTIAGGGIDTVYFPVTLVPGNNTFNAYTFVTEDLDVTNDSNSTSIFYSFLYTSTTAIDVACPESTNGLAAVSVDSGGVAPFTYMWSDANMTTTSNIQNLAAGAYSVTVTDADGCESVEQLSIVALNGTPSVSITGADTICGDGSSTLDAGAGFDAYAWGSGATTQTINVTSTATYMVTITDTNGCVNDASFDVFAYDLITLTTSGVDVTCEGGADGVVAATATGGTTSFNYEWSDGAQVSSNIDVEAGTYIVTVDDGSGCIVVDSVTIGFLFNNPTFSFAQANVAGEASVVVNAGGSFSDYDWSNGANTEEVTFTTSGAYTLTVTDTNGCSTSDVINVEIWPLGVNQVEATTMSVYPNPSTGIFNLTLGNVPADQVELVVLNVNGQVVTTSTAAASNGIITDVIDLGNAASGIYFLQVNINGSVSTLRLNVQ